MQESVQEVMWKLWCVHTYVGSDVQEVVLRDCMVYRK